MDKQDGVIDIHGKGYKTVALRVHEFRAAHPIEEGWRIDPKVISAGEDVVMVRAEIRDPGGRLVAAGHAEERRGSSQINRTSALENCETSAIGRALAAAGLGGTEYASANEVENAIHQQDSPPPKTREQEQQDKIREILISDIGIDANDRGGAEACLRYASEGHCGIEDIARRPATVLGALQSHWEHAGHSWQGYATAAIEWWANQEEK